MKSRLAMVALSLAAMLGAACAPVSTLDRRHARGTPTSAHVPVASVPVHGFQVEVRMSGAVVEGELLAVDETSIWVDELGIERTIPRAEVVRVVIHEHDNVALAYALWTAAGAFSTFTHGYYFVFTGPLWAAIGAPISAVESSDGYQRATHDGLDALFQFARWPQGMPPR